MSKTLPRHWARKKIRGAHLWYAGYNNLIRYSLQYDGRRVKDLKELDERIKALNNEIDDNHKTVQAIDDCLNNHETIITDTVRKVILDGKQRLLSRREVMQSDRLMVQLARDDWLMMQKATEAERAFLTAKKA